MRYARLTVSGIFIVCIFVQAYLAGRGAFGAGSYQAHKDFGSYLHYVPGIILILTLVNRATRNRADVILGVLLVVLFELQAALGDLKHPDAGAFHPANALLLLAVAAALFARDLRALRARQPITELQTAASVPTAVSRETRGAPPNASSR